MLKKIKLNTYLSGILAEFIAIIYLSCKFYIFLHRRYKNKYGEIDLIFYKKNQIIFCEVKFRKIINQFENLVKINQIKRIKMASNFFLRENDLYNKYLQRYDLIFISLIPLKIHHIENI